MTNWSPVTQDLLPNLGIHCLVPCLGAEKFKQHNFTKNVDIVHYHKAAVSPSLPSTSLFSVKCYIFQNGNIQYDQSMELEVEKQERMSDVL